MKSDFNKLQEEQKLDLLFSEISSVEESGVPGKEFEGILNRYSEELILTLEKMQDPGSHSVITALLIKKVLRNLHTPVCLLDRNKKVIFYNQNWRKIFEFDNIGNVSVMMEMNKVISFVRDTILMNRPDETGTILREHVLSGEYLLHIYPFSMSKQENYFLLDLRKTITKDSQEIVPVDSVSDQEFFYQKSSYSEAILEAIDGFHFLLDSEARITTIAGHVEEKLGFVVSELTGTPLELLIKQDHRASFRRMFSEIRSGKVSSSNKAQQIGEIEFLKKQGTTNFFEMTLTPYQHSGHQAVAGICIDIQKRIVKEQRLEKEKLKAQSRDRLKSDFLADMSHEIRTPLNGIIGFSSILDREGLSQDKREKYMHIIRSSSRQLLTIVNDIIDISKIEAGQFRMVYSRFDPGQLMEELYIATKQEAVRLNKVKIRIKKQWPEGNDDVRIFSDEVRIRQVMINLINNALKFTEKGEISFGYTLDNTPDTIKFYVRDTGTGISKENQEYIFDRFRQTPEGASSGHMGTGLGLAISKGIVEILGGKIRLNSEINSGTEFYFTLPLQQPSED